MITYDLNTIPLYGTAPVVVHVNQYEYGRQVLFHVTDADGDEMRFGGEYGTLTITLNLKKGDNTVYSMIVPHEGNMIDGYVYVTLTEQMTAAAGRGWGELVFEHNGIRHGTANFIWDVERSPLDMYGVESESLIGYVEGNREAAQEATEAAGRAAEAADNAAYAADTAASSVNSAIANIESMPEALRALAATLAAAGDPKKFLAYNSNGAAVALDIDIVTPQMFGARGDGTVNDGPAFEAAFASGKRVVIPEGRYVLGTPLWTDDSVVISDKGTYLYAPLIVSRALREGPPILRMVKEFNASLSNARDYRVQTGCYDPVNERIILAYCYKNENPDPSNPNNYTSDLVLTAYDLDWNPISGLSVVIPDAGHGNSVVYAPDINSHSTPKIYVIVGNRDLSDASVGQIAVINPDDLSFDRFISPVTESNRTWQMAYDADNKIFYLQYTMSGGTSMFRAFDSELTPLSKTFPSGEGVVSDIGKFDYGTDGLNLQGPLVVNGQFLQVMYGTKYGTAGYGSNGALIAQYNYHTGEIKKVYRVTSPYPADEPQCLINVKGRFYFISDSSQRDGYRNVCVHQFVMDDRMVGETESPYTDAKLLSSSRIPSNLNDIITPGLYVATGEAGANNSRGLTNDPCPQAFALFVTPLMVRDTRAQIAISSHGEVYIRTFIPSRSGNNKWYDWRQLAETPRLGGSRSGTWRGSGYILNGATTLYFTIPYPTQTITDAAPSTVTVTDLTLSAWQGGTLIGGANIVEDGVAASGWTVSASVGVWGINMTVTKSSEISGATNAAPVAIQANVNLSYGMR